MSETQTTYPLSRQEKIASFLTGLVFEGIGIAVIADGEIGGGVTMATVGLGFIAASRWAEFKNEESARLPDFYTGTHRDENGQPV